MSEEKASGMTIASISSIPLILVLGNSMLIPMLPKMKSILHLTQLQVSMVISVFSVAAAISIPVLGYLSDRFSRKAIMIPALIVYGGGGLLAGAAAAWFSHAYIWIMAGRILQGIGASGTAPLAMALTGDLYQGGERSKVLGLVEASNGFGKVVSPIIGALLGLLIWYAVFFVFPVFCGIATLLVIVFIKEKKKQSNTPGLKQYTKSMFGVFKQDGRWLFTSYMVGAVCLFTLFGILFYLSDVLEKSYHIKGVTKGLVLAIPLLFMSVTSYVSGSKIGQNKKLMKTLILIGLLLMTASFSTLVFFRSLVPFIGVLIFSSIGTGLALPCINSFITGSVNKEKRGFVTSLYNSVRFLGVAAGPPVYGAMMSWSRMGMFWTTAGLVFLIAIASFFFIRVNDTQSEGDKQKEEAEDLPRDVHLHPE